MVHINGVLLVLSSVILAGIATPAVHEDCAESHLAVEHVVLHERSDVNVALEERQHVKEEHSTLEEHQDAHEEDVALEEEEEEEESALEERQHVHEDKVVNAQMQAEYEEEASHLQVSQSAKAAAQESEDISTVAKSGAAAVNTITNYMRNIAMDAAILDKSVAAVTRRMTVSQGLALQRQFASLTLILSQGTRIIKSARPLNSVESRQILVALKLFENNFLNLLATTIAKKTTFERLPFNIIPFLETALSNLGSKTDGFDAALQNVVSPSSRQTVTTHRRTMARAFAKALVTYA